MKCFDVSMKRISASIPPSPRLLLRLCHRLSMNNNPQELSNLSQELFRRKFKNLLCDTCTFSDKIGHVPQPIQTKYKPSHHKL